MFNTEYYESFPHQVQIIEHTWIALSDGCRLSAKLWLPTDAHQHPVPAILEYIPYRKGDATAPRDQMNHAYFAGHGYASVRVDMRGTGNSDGIQMDEYLALEQQDGLRQPLHRRQRAAGLLQHVHQPSGVHRVGVHL